MHISFNYRLEVFVFIHCQCLHHLHTFHSILNPHPKSVVILVPFRLYLSHQKPVVRFGVFQICTENQIRGKERIFHLANKLLFIIWHSEWHKHTASPENGVRMVSSSTRNTCSATYEEMRILEISYRNQNK